MPRMMQWITTVSLSAGLLCACGGGGGDGGPPPGDELMPEFSSIQDHVFTPICTDCHAGANPSAGMSLEEGESYGNLVNVHSNEVPLLFRVEPNDAENSYLIHKLEGRQAVGSRMPLGKPPLPPEDIAIIRQWIAEGAQPPAQPIGAFFDGAAAP